MSQFFECIILIESKKEIGEYYPVPVDHNVGTWGVLELVADAISATVSVVSPVIPVNSVPLCSPVVDVGGPGCVNQKLWQI